MLKLTSVLIYQQFSGLIPATVATLSLSFNSAKYLYILLLFDYGITQAIKNPPCDWLMVMTLCLGSACHTFWKAGSVDDLQLDIGRAVIALIKSTEVSIAVI
ncbi:hypothetical protein [Fluviicoccus sp.]|uniref:hypothetical protein n=1 Tax=Fluviicoccus sp. TaxID=2003552 RepID=UPI00272D979F|nr:hypothetical protein [Fluviicoccus sp.]